MNQGKYFRCAALAQGNRVKVIFRNKKGNEMAFFMSPETYDAIPLNKEATIEDYRKYGLVQKAKTVNIYEDK